LKRGFRQ